MRLDKLTLKAQETLQSSQQLAERMNHQQIDPEHMVRCILDQAEGVIPPILGKIGADQKRLVREFDAVLDKIPRVSGAGYGQVYISPRLKTVLDKAFEEAEPMKDEYVSLEHILLAVSDESEGDAARILAASGVTRDAVLTVLVDIRGGQRITDQNPEDKYQAIE